MTPPGDYYDGVAGRYDRHRGGAGPYVGALAELAGETKARLVLEIGSGTGNSARAFTRAYPCELIALEPSGGMIAQRRRKRLSVRWVRAVAEAIPLTEGSVDFVFGVLVLHHIRDVAPVFGECARALKRGYAAFVTSPHSYIDRHPMSRYFPSFARVEKARFQSLETLEAELRRAGFGAVGSQVRARRPEPIDRHYVEKVAGKYLSTYDLIPEEEFERGLERLRADVARYGQVGVSAWESLIVWGRK